MTIIDPNFQVVTLLDRRLVGKRVKILRETRQVLHKLSKKPSPKKITPREQSELKRYNKWLSGACEELAKLSNQGEKLLKQTQATKSVLAMQQSFNLQYLQLQQKMQGENRQFTLMSNIMKVKHDTAKSAINNVR